MVVAGRKRAQNRLVLDHRSDVTRPFSDLLHHGLEIDAFFDAVDSALAAVVPFDASCWLGLDPSTLLPTSHFTREATFDHPMSVAANEFLDEDVNKFADLARAERPVALMSEATAGAPTDLAHPEAQLAAHAEAARTPALAAKVVERLNADPELSGQL